MAARPGRYDPRPLRQRPQIQVLLWAARPAASRAPPASVPAAARDAVGRAASLLRAGRYREAIAPLEAAATGGTAGRCD
jgi:hypothetical protein